MNPDYPQMGSQMGYQQMQVPQMYRSNTPKTLGVLSIVFGSIIAAMSAIGLAAGKQFGSMVQAHGNEAAFDRFIAETHAVSVLQSTAMLVMSLLLIYIGTGQRKYMRWASGASVKWGIAALVYLVVNAIVQFTVVMPALDRFMTEISHANIDVPVGAIMKVSQFIGLAMYAAYPIVMISAFRKPHNIASMDQPPPTMPTATVVSQ
jgi:uncharacterized membrane protein (DUF485 family)